MIDLNAALTAITAAARDRFQPLDITDIEAHPGEFTDDELARFRVGRVALRLSVLDITEVNTDGRGTRGAVATLALFVIATDRKDRERAAQALAAVSEALEWLTHNQFNAPSLLPVDPKTISAQNLYSGDLDKTTGVAFWGIRWQQRIKATH